MLPRAQRATSTSGPRPRHPTPNKISQKILFQFQRYHFPDHSIFLIQVQQHQPSKAQQLSEFLTQAQQQQNQVSCISDTVKCGKRVPAWKWFYQMPQGTVFWPTFSNLPIIHFALCGQHARPLTRMRAGAGGGGSALEEA